MEKEEIKDDKKEERVVQLDRKPVFRRVFPINNKPQEAIKLWKQHS